MATGPSLFTRVWSPRILSALYLVMALGFGVLAFRNYSPLTVIVTVLLVAVLPLSLIWWGAFAPPETVVGWRRVSGLVVGAGVLLVVQATSLHVWRNYVANLPNLRLEAGDGYHEDTAFHVAIIQGILHHGVITTGQHLETGVSYHSLSHLVDAGLLAILRLDPWESYALLFFAKGVALTLAIIFYATQVGRSVPSNHFGIRVALLLLPFSATWVVIGSHGQWVPMLLLILLAPWLFRLARERRVTWPHLLALTALIVTTSFGKVSIGFGIALLIGFWLFLQKPLDARVLLAGVSWLGFFALFSAATFSTRISGGQDDTLAERFYLSWPDIWSLGVLIALISVIGIVSGSRVIRAFSGAVVLSFVSVTGLSAMVLTSGSDVAYFFHGLQVVALLMAIPLLEEAWAAFGGRTSADPATSLKVTGMATLAWASSVLLAVSPILAQPALSPTLNGAEMLEDLPRINTTTYTWHNALAESTDSLSVLRVLVRGGKTSLGETYTPYFERLTEELDSLDREWGMPPGEALLFLSSEDFDWLTAEYTLNDEWATGLLITAVTGKSLLFGVKDHTAPNYGFPFYDASALRRSAEEITEAELCEFGRPVIVATDIRVPRFDVMCDTESPPSSNDSRDQGS